MYIERLIDRDLLEWSTATSRKPLLIRGARQVGKSTAVRHLAEKFEFFIEINFDEQPQYASLFKENISIDETIEQLSLITNTNIIEGKTLLFLDEIQACLPAISALRYFYERKPNLHVIAAGSLLEFALSELPSFGVGRMVVYPLSFTEFLGAMNEKALVNAIRQSSANEPLNEIVHNKIKMYLKKFLIIGGMPEVVQTFISNRNLLEVQRLLDDLIISIQDDFTKYKKRIPSERVKLVFDSIVQQVGMKYRYSDQHSSLTSVQIKQVIDLLEMAGLVHPVTHSSCNGVPLGAESNIKKRKYLVFDTGIFQRMLGLDVASVLMKDDFEVVNKGNIAELFVGLELLKLKSCFEKTPLYYWHRESKNSQAEVDYVVQLQNKIVPIEVKEGTKGTMQSMFLFMDEKHSDLGVRLSLENFSQYEKVRVYPLYAVSNVLESANE